MRFEVEDFGIPSSRERSLRVRRPVADAASASSTAAARVTAGAGDALPSPSEVRATRESAMILLQVSRAPFVRMLFNWLNSNHHSVWRRLPGAADNSSLVPLPFRHSGLRQVEPSGRGHDRIRQLADAGDMAGNGVAGK